LAAFAALLPVLLAFCPCWRAAIKCLFNSTAFSQKKIFGHCGGLFCGGECGEAHSHSLLGQINVSNLLISALLAPMAWIGVKLGLRIQDSFNAQQFKQIILSLMILVGLRLLWTALIP